MACGKKGSLKRLAVKLGIQQTDLKRTQERIVATHDYRDEDSSLLFQVVRFEPKSFKQRRPDGKGGWKWNLDGIRRVLYRLPELLATPMDQTVFLVEGEKAADALARLGLAATCSPMGAGKWRDEYAPPFAGRNVVVLPDADDPGEMHAGQAAASLARVTKSLKVVPLPGLDHGQDVYDWLADGNTIEDLLRLTEAAPDWESQKGSEVLDAIVTFIRRFVILSLHQAEAIALWVVHTYMIAVAETTPYLNIYSAEKRSGKTRLLEVLELLVARPWFTGRVTAAVLARKVDAERPTLLLDESDAAFKGDKEYAQTLRALLNSGYRLGGKASICVGQGASIGYKDLSTFCAKAIAGIGKLPDTVADRSTPILLQRRAPDESIERFRRKRADSEAASLRKKLLQWVSVTSISDTEIDIPDRLDDRAADCWEPLLAIADAAGGDWPRRARDTAVALTTGVERENESLGIQLLADIRLIFQDSAVCMPSAEIVPRLLQIEESPWGNLKGRPLDARYLAFLLRPFGIHPQTFRIDDRTQKGYRKTDFQDTWNRYLPRSASSSVTSVTPDSDQIQIEAAGHPQQTPFETPGVTDNPQSCPTNDVTDVTDKSREVSETATISQISTKGEGSWEMEI